MSYYGPNYANIKSGWYRATSDETYAVGRKLIDKYWNQCCDAILIRHVEKHGTFFTAFSDRIIAEIDLIFGSKLQIEARYFEYYLANRAYEMEKTRTIWLTSHTLSCDVTFVCPYCTKQFRLIKCHPDLIAALGVPPKQCRSCNYIVKRYRLFWSPDLEKRVSSYIQNSHLKRACELCPKEYLPEGSLFTYGNFDNNPVDFVYPNLFLNICPMCFKKVYRDHNKGSQKLRLSRLYRLFKFIGKVPNQDFSSLFYYYKDHDSILALMNIFKFLRTPKGYRQEFGSFFAALVRSGVLPDGTKRTTFGTITLSNDGHLCLSLVEKEIDDFLYSNGVPHDKEVYYPGSRMRADWEVLRQKTRIFIEYFGLSANVNYSKKIEIKKRIAKDNNIVLIELYPESNWEKILSNSLSLNCMNG